MNKSLRGKKPAKNILVDKAVHDSLAELREYSQLPLIQLLNQLFESKGLIARNTINNFFEDFSTTIGQRKFKEWRQLKKLKEQDNE